MSSDGPLDALTAYEVRHLVRHLFDARRARDVHHLLRLETSSGANALYEAKEDTTGFLADVDLAWQLADASDRPDLRLRYALVGASIRSRSGNTPPGLLAALVDRGLLSATAALGNARQAPDTVVRGRGLAAVAARLPEAERTAVLAEAIEAARGAGRPERTLDVLRAIAAGPLPEMVVHEAVAVADEIDSDGSALAMLAPALPEGHRSAVLDRALECARNAALRLHALVDVLPALPAEERTALAADVLQQVVRPQVWQGREYVSVSAPEVLRALAPQLNRDQAAQAFDAARWIDDPEQQVAVLAALAPRVDDRARPAGLGAARAAVQKIDTKWSRADALVLLAPYLSPRELRYAMRIDTLGRDKRLQQLAPHLPGRFVRRYVRSVRKLHSDAQRAPTLSALVPYVTGEQLKQVLPEAFALASRERHLDALERLAPYLDDSQLRAAQAATRIDDSGATTAAIAALAQSLPRDHAAEALAACAALTEEHERTERLIALAPHLPERQLLDALEIARQSKNFMYRVRGLVGVARHLPEDERDDALRDVVAAIRKAPRRDRDAMAELGSIAELVRGQALRDTLDLVLAEGRGWQRTQVNADLLAALAPHLPEPLLERALGQLGDPADGDYPVEMLAALAPNLPERLQPAALDAAEQLQFGTPAVVAALAPRLDQSMQERALAIARANGSTVALATLASHVSDGDVVAEAIRAIEDDPDPACIRALARGLAAKRHPLTPDGQRKLLEVALGLDSPGRWEALDAIRPLLSGELVDEALVRGRPLTDDPAMVIAILAPGFPELRRRALLDEALEGVKSLGSPASHFTLAALAPQLDDGQIEAMVAWVAGAGVDDSHPGPSVTDAAWALTPVLTDRAFVGLFGAALGLGADWQREKVLDSMMGAAGRAGSDSLNRAFGEWLASTRLRSRETVLGELAALTPAIARITPSSGIAHVTDAIADVARWWP